MLYDNDYEEKIKINFDLPITNIRFQTQYPNAAGYNILRIFGIELMGSFLPSWFIFINKVFYTKFINLLSFLDDTIIKQYKTLWIFFQFFSTFANYDKLIQNFSEDLILKICKYNDRIIFLFLCVIQCLSVWNKKLALHQWYHKNVQNIKSTITTMVIYSYIQLLYRINAQLSVIYNAYTVPAMIIISDKA